MTYIKINGITYPATINGDLSDYSWDNRESKTIIIEMTCSEANSLFVNGLKWSILNDVSQEQEDGTVITVQEEYDNSEFSIAGDIIDHRDGTLSVKMGKATQLEKLEKENAALLFENLTGEVLA